MKRNGFKEGSHNCLQRSKTLKHPPAPANDAIANGFITVDQDWIITSLNPRAALILGLESREIIGRSCHDIFNNDPRFRDICRKIDDFIEEHGNENIELTLSNPLTSEKDAIRLRIITLPGKDGTITGAIIGFADLTEPLAAGRLALNSINEGVFSVDRSWKLTSFNRAAEKITGWKEEEVLGRSCNEIFRANICNSNCAISDCIYKKSSLSERMAYIETKAGKSIPVKVSAAPLLDADNNIIGGVETFRDITSTMQYELILDAVADGVFTVNAKGEITSFNKAAEKITGWREQEVLGKKCSTILLSSTNVESCTLNRCMREKRTIVDRELFIIGKDGFSIPVSVSAAPFIGHNGDILGGVESFRDNTNRLQNALILDSIADGVFTVDRDWRITSFNLAAELITGWSRQKAVGQYCSDVFCAPICNEKYLKRKKSKITRR